MSVKYSCPQCGKELYEEHVITSVCPHCYAVFDKTTIEKAPPQEDLVKGTPGEGAADEKMEEEREDEESPSRTIDKG